jgi:hypothetical protein
MVMNMNYIFGLPPLRVNCGKPTFSNWSTDLEKYGITEPLLGEYWIYHRLAVYGKAELMAPTEADQAQTNTNSHPQTPVK